MKKLLILFTFFTSIVICSCTVDDVGETHVTSLGWLLIVGLPILFVFMVKSGQKNKVKTDAFLAKRGIKQTDIVPYGTYVGGHPDADENINYAVIYPKDKKLIIAKQLHESIPPEDKVSIVITSIKDITVEDASSIEKKVTLGRVLLTGVFALAWRKSKKNELAFVSIDWNDGKFNHSTLFSFEGKDAMQKANTARNKLIKIAR